jgi:hypothetical protein
MSQTTNAMGSPNLVANLLFVALLLFGCYSIGDMMVRNGYYAAMVKLRDDGPRFLPGSDNPVQMKYVGIYAIDYWLIVLNCVFANIVDGSQLHLSLYFFHFAGQLVPVWTVMLIESLRYGSGRNLISYFVIWALSMQAFGYWMFMPVYAIVHLSVSQNQPATYSPDKSIFRLSKLRAIPWSMFVGYIIPSFLASQPSISSTLRQYYVSLWQVFPLWVELSQVISGITLSFFQGPGKSKGPKVNSSQQKDLLRRVYIFSTSLSAITHLATFALLFGHDTISTLVPSLKPAMYSFKQVFVPPVPWSQALAPDMPTAVLCIMQYDQYIGSSAFLLWSIVLYRQVYPGQSPPLPWYKLIPWVAAVSVLGGPTTAATWLLWRRDERNFW